MKSAQWDIVERQEYRIRRQMQLQEEVRWKEESVARQKREEEDAKKSLKSPCPPAPTFTDDGEIVWKPDREIES